MRRLAASAIIATSGRLWPLMKSRSAAKAMRILLTRREGESISYLGKRHAARLMSDAYGKGIVRGQAENTNLRANAKANDVTAADTFRTSQAEAFFRQRV